MRVNDFLKDRNAYSDFLFVVFTIKSTRRMNTRRTGDEENRDNRRYIIFRDKARKWKGETRCKNQATPEIKQERKLVPSLFSLVFLFFSPPSLRSREANQITIHFVDRRATRRRRRSGCLRDREKSNAGARERIEIVEPARATLRRGTRKRMNVSIAN